MRWIDFLIHCLCVDISLGAFSIAMMAFNNYIVFLDSGTDLANEFRCKQETSAEQNVSMPLTRRQGTFHALTANESPSI